MQVTPSPRSERGFSMFIVIMAMFVTSMFVAAGVRGGQRRPAGLGREQEPQVVLRGGRGRLDYYLNHLQEDTGLLDPVRRRRRPERGPRSTRSTSSGTAAAPTRARWRTIPGVDAEYTIEILHHAGFTQVRTDTTKQESVIDMSTGTFKIRVTGPRDVGHDAPARDHRDVPPQGLPEVRLLHRLREPRPAGAPRAPARAPRSRPTASTSTARHAPARAARRSSSPRATRSTVRCTPTTRAS